MDAPLPEGLAEMWVEFLLNDQHRTTGANAYREVFQHPTLFPLQRMAETTQMMRLAKTIGPRVIYEIGTDKGGGLYHWCKCLPTVERVAACEIRGTPYSEAFDAAFPHNFLWLPVSSYAERTVVNLGQWLDGDRIDVAFIDGDKSAFYADFANVMDFMDPHGIVFLHDFRDEGPREAVDLIRRNHKVIDCVDISESVAASTREIAGIPPESSYEGWLRHWKGTSAGWAAVMLGEKS